MRKHLYRASVLFAAIGIVLIHVSTLHLELEEVDIGDIETDWAGKNVEIGGNITDFYRSGDHLFITLEDRTGDILVVDFDSELEPERGDTLTVEGYVEIYRGTLEVIAEEIHY